MTFSELFLRFKRIRMVQKLRKVENEMLEHCQSVERKKVALINLKYEQDQLKKELETEYQNIIVNTRFTKTVDILNVN